MKKNKKAKSSSKKKAAKKPASASLKKKVAAPLKKELSTAQKASGQKFRDKLSLRPVSEWATLVEASTPDE